MLKESAMTRALLVIPTAAPASCLSADLAFSPRPLLPDISELREFKPCPKHSHQSPCGGKRWGHEAPGHCPAHVLLHFLFGFVGFKANKNHSEVKTLLMGEIINQQVCWMHSVWYRVGGLQGMSVLLFWKARGQLPRNLLCPVLQGVGISNVCWKK